MSCMIRENSRYCVAMRQDIPSEDIRTAMLDSIDRFTAASGKSDSFVGKEALKDDKFVSRVRKGGNFTIKTYQRVLDWLASQQSGSPQPTPTQGEVA